LKTQNVELEVPLLFGQSEAKLKFLTFIYSPCRKSTAVCWKTADPGLLACNNANSWYKKTIKMAHCYGSHVSIDSVTC